MFYVPISAALSSYSHYVFATLDHNDSGIITFEVRNNDKSKHNTTVKAQYIGTRIK